MAGPLATESLRKRRRPLGANFIECKVDARDGRGGVEGLRQRRRALVALCHHEDEVEDGLSDCEPVTVFACPDYDGAGSTFDDTDLAGDCT